jgi:hypothetical protein
MVIYSNDISKILIKSMGFLKRDFISNGDAVFDVADLITLINTIT